MAELEHIHKQLARSFCSDRWLFPAVRDSLESVSAATAAARPIAKAHTIWEIVVHMTRWKEAALRMLRGEEVNRTYDPDNVWDWPPVTVNTDDAWPKAVQQLEKAHEELLAVVENMDESQLERLVPGERFTTGELLHGVIEHDHYHSGQIALLKKAGTLPGA